MTDDTPNRPLNDAFARRLTDVSMALLIVGSSSNGSTEIAPGVRATLSSRDPREIAFETLLGAIELAAGAPEYFMELVFQFRAAHGEQDCPLTFEDHATIIRKVLERVTDGRAGGFKIDVELVRQ